MRVDVVYISVVYEVDAKTSVVVVVVVVGIIVELADDRAIKSDRSGAISPRSQHHIALL